MDCFAVGAIVGICIGVVLALVMAAANIVAGDGENQDIANDSYACSCPDLARKALLENCPKCGRGLLSLHPGGHVCE